MLPGKEHFCERSKIIGDGQVFFFFFLRKTHTHRSLVVPSQMVIDLPVATEVFYIGLRSKWYVIPG